MIKELNGGSEWPDTIAEHLSNSTICMAFHSRTSVQSVNCRQEIYYAIRQKKSILSVYLDDVHLCEGLDMQLSPIQSLALFKYKDYTDFYKLIENTKMLQRCCNLPEGNEISVSDWNIDNALDEQFKKAFSEERKIAEIKARNFMQELEDKVKNNELLENDGETSFHEYLLLPYAYNKDDIKGKHFTIPNRTGVKTIIFQAYTLTDYKTMKAYYTCELLESIEEEDNPSNTIFFIEDPAPDGNTLILLHFDTVNNEVYLNMGMLLGNSLHITRKPAPLAMQHIRLSDKLCLSDAAYDIEKLSNKEKEDLLESSETYDSVWHEANISECPFIIIDPETIEPIRREVFYDDKVKQWRARIKIETFKSYFAFDIRSSDSDERYRAITTIQKAYYYRNGSHGFPKNLMKAISYYEEDGSSEAVYEIAQIFATEKTMYDEESYFEYLNKAALLGYEKAEVELFMLSFEKYDDKDRKEKFNILLDKVSGEKSTIGNFISGYFLEKGIISKENIGLAFELYYQAACNGFNPALIRLHCEKSMQCEELKLKDKNSLYDKFVSSKFNGDAEYCFGCTLFFGYNILPNKKDGIKYLHLAADMKNKQAIYTLYKIYDLDEEYGNKKEALKWLKLIEEFGDSYQVKLANWLIDGIGCECCEQNDKQAFDILQKASQSGNKTAIHNLAWVYKEGRGCDIDYKKAEELFKKASRPNSFYYLGDIYENGLDVTKNMEKALEYYKLGAERGSQIAIKHLKEINENM